MMLSFCKNVLFLRILLFTLCLSVSTNAAASEKDPVSIELLSESSSIEPDNTFWLLVHFKIDPEWHIYWENPGDAGAPPQISWKLPTGFIAQNPIFPTPKRFVVASAVGFGYDTDVSLLVPIKAPNNLQAGTSVSLEATITYVACKTLCIPGKWEGNITLPIAAHGSIDNVTSAQFTTARNTIPHVVSDITTTRQDHTVLVTVPMNGNEKAIANVQFFPKNMGTVDIQSTPTWTLQDDKKTLTATLYLDKNIAEEAVLDGILLITLDDNKDISIALNSPIKAAPIPVSKYHIPVEKTTAPQDTIVATHLEIQSMKQLMTKDFLAVLCFTFLGGMLLNLMPCVLPVISIKLVHYIKIRGQSYVTQLKQGLLFTLGILISFWTLAGIIFFLQAAGKTVGWGFQLQEPLFVAALIIIMFILSLSLFGVFEFGLKIATIAQEIEEHGKGPQLISDRIPSPWSSFLSGVLATFVATPCTGPLLGSALGLTATLNPSYSFLIFTALGLGMAFPYLLLSLFPGFTYLIPRPGRWMVTFKQLMGFFMMATVVWLVWVLAAETVSLSLTHVLASFFIISFGLWIYGTWGGIDRKRSVRAIGRLLTLLLIIYGSYILISQVYSSRNAAQISQTITQTDEWEPFSLERLQELQEKNIVFVNVTAKWCLTCQANKIVLESRAVKAAFKKYHIVKMVADWTHGDEKITQYIQSIGRNGVPVYAIYAKGSDQPPQILPELLTPDIVLQAIDAISK